MFTYLFDGLLRRVFSLSRVDGIYLCIRPWLEGIGSSPCPRFFLLSLPGVWREIRPHLFTTTSVPKLIFFTPISADGRSSHFRLRVLANHLAFFFLSLVTECQHLLAFTLIHILYFHGQTGRRWFTLLFLFLTVSLWRPTNSNTRDSRNSLLLSVGDHVTISTMLYIKKKEKEICRKTRAIIRTELNAKNKIIAIKALAISVVIYSFVIVNWTSIEKKDGY